MKLDFVVSGFQPGGRYIVFERYDSRSKKMCHDRP